MRLGVWQRLHEVLLTELNAAPLLGWSRYERPEMQPAKVFQRSDGKGVLNPFRPIAHFAMGLQY